jgi:hypothetical protein
MRIADSLLIAPALFCVVGFVVGALTEIGQSRLWAAVAAASLVALALYWLVGRIRPPPQAKPYSSASNPRAKP